MFRKYIAVVLSVVIAFTFSGCGAEETQTDEVIYVTDGSLETHSTIVSNFVERGQNKSLASTPAKEENIRTKTISITKSNTPYFKTLGICVFGSASGIELNWSNSSVEFYVNTSGRVILNFVLNAGQKIFLRLVIDGKPLNNPILINASGDYKIADNLSQGTHKIKIIRITDAQAGALKLSKIKTAGSLVESQPKPASLYIQALGDHSLLGTGILLDDNFFKSENFSLSKAQDKAYQDSTKTYTYLVAEKLGADISTIALQNISIGLSLKYLKTESGEYQPDIANGTLPEIYKRANIVDSAEYNQTRKPDIIVVDCGRCDIDKSFQQKMEKTTGSPCNNSTVMTKTINFFKDLKSKNPKVKIIWCYGFAGQNSTFKDHMQRVLNVLGGQENGFYFLELKTTTRNINYFSEAEHKANSEILANKIKAII